MTEQNPAPQPSQPAPWVPNPAQGAWQAAPGVAPGAAPQVLAVPGDPYAGGTGGQSAYVPPLRHEEPKPPRPALTKAAAHRARLAGGVGGGITWLGLGITQLSALLLAVPIILGMVVGGIGFAGSTDGTSATAGAWERTLAWLGSPWGIVLIVGIPAGIVIALLGLWLSTRMLRHPGIARPVGVTWAGFGLSVAGAVLLSGLGSVTLPFFGGIPFGFDGGRDFDPGFDPGLDRGFDGFGPDGQPDQGELHEWLSGPGGDVLQQVVDPGTVLGFLGPWAALAQLAALILPIIAGVFTWWWMAHAMRPAAPVEAAEQPEEQPAG